jgi:hypothetical protein
MGGGRNQLRSKPAWVCILVRRIQENLDGNNTRDTREDRRCTLIDEDEVDNRVGCRCVVLSNGSLPLLRIYFWCVGHLPSVSFVLKVWKNSRVIVLKHLPPMLGASGC